MLAPSTVSTLPMERLLTGRELKTLRHATGMTQQEFAREIGVSRVAVARWETNVRRISEPIAKLVRIVVARHSA
jgi:DNA-binding transcriptional regulator YiaG